MAQAILRLLEDDQLASFLGQNGIETAQKLSWERTGREFERLFMSTLT